MTVPTDPTSAALPETPAEPVELEVGPVAHGGHCVARHEGRVVFVRHALPGEKVLARLTDTGEAASFWRADAVKVLEASPDRVRSAWPQAGPGGVGGGELAHVSLDAQRTWKASVVAEQMSRLAKLERDVVVEGAPGDDARGGLGWRTRIELVADDEGRAGMRRPRSHDVLPLHTMPLATEQVLEAAEAERVFSRRWRAGSRIEVVAPASGADPLVLVDGLVWRSGHVDKRPNARRTVTESVRVDGTDLDFRVAADGFWQVHREAPSLLAQVVLDAARGGADGDLTDATVLDLFSGAGLFTVPLARAVGPVGRVVAVEGDERAAKDARRNAHAYEQVEIHHGQVATVLRTSGHGAVGGADVVVLDPPRTGAGAKTVREVVALSPSRVVYVACDPAALARDVAYFAEAGYNLSDLRAFDLFPMTHHVECVAVLTR
ncbi:class I SAM-dependent RNA methyltransferase [Sanguibacter suaedae]|uniref:Class I SAM-dependent RNA methyltransferase n=1 Tax=Sanguibacter suaedae TaxID=2795737 RepID=A0A934MAG5_9MICO|nr:TRAM domain-containing protein [Sanguibacter suaedae]MBI9114206.1 class I SAM-dependent RNA methyltransferase [Sanguibacter suaedae]